MSALHPYRRIPCSKGAALARFSPGSVVDAEEGLAKRQTPGGYSFIS
jgi:hypothetical protein